MRRRGKKGFTLIEIMIGMAIGFIMMAAMGTVLIQMFTGFREMHNFAQATHRVDIIRGLTFDARTGDRLLFPTTDGATGAWSAGGFTGQQVRFRVVNFNPTTTVSTRVFVNWESRRLGTTKDPFTVTRWTQLDANNDGVENDGGYVKSYGQGDIEAFDVRRVSRSNFTVNMRTTEGEEKAHVQLAVTLRNATQ